MTLQHLLGLIVAYVAGSIPAAYIAGRLVRGIDLREYGSGNLGATNVYRELGRTVAVAVMLFDAAKGALPVLVLPRLITGGDPVPWAIAYGVAAIVGHVRPIFLRWKGGGKGVATSSGVFAALVPLPMLVTFLAWVAIIWGTGYVSLASLSAALLLPLTILVMVGPRTPVLAVAIVVGGFVFWTHRANIGRLRRGEESRFSRRPRGEGAG